MIAATVNFRLVAPEILAILRHAEPSVFVYEEQYQAVVEQIRAEFPDLQLVSIGNQEPSGVRRYADLFSISLQEDAPLAVPSEDDFVYLLYTSGTTGKPKGVLSTHARAVRLAEIMSGELDMQAASRSLIATPLFHVGAVNILNAQRWKHGASVILRTSESHDLAHAIDRHRVNTVFFVPLQLQRLLDVADSGGYELNSLSTIVMAGAPIPAPLLQRGIERLGPVFIVQYGLTEAQCTTLYKHELLAEARRPAGRLNSVGHVQPQSELAILDAQDRPLPSGEIGEICIRGPSVMNGYRRREAATQEAMRGGWLHTDDVGYMDAAGYVFLIDRKKDIIISGGENIYSREVEDALHAHGLVQDAAVVGMPDEKWGEAVVAYVVLRTGAMLTEDDLRAHARTRIAPYKCPKRIVFVRELPRLVTGKVNKALLRSQSLEAKKH